MFNFLRKPAPAPYKVRDLFDESRADELRESAIAIRAAHNSRIAATRREVLAHCKGA